MFDDNFYLIMGSIFLAYYFTGKTKESFSQQGGSLTNKYNDLYSNLRNEWKNIFPDSNRNAGGVQFFYYIYEKMKPTKEEFDIYNKFYCGVSGSLIDPERILTNSGSFGEKNNANSFIRVKHINGGYMCGFYYRCCWPCGCDIMNENMVDVLVEDITLELKDGSFKYHVLTINDPCSNSIIINGKEVLPNPNNSKKKWNEVSSFNCKNKKTINATKTNSGRIIFAILFDASECTLQKYKDNNNFESELYDLCQKRNSNQDGLQEWGMGDIFVNLSKK